MSQPAYDHKYSDRDVRENPELRDLAIEYVNKYGGSFDPLLRIKMFLVDHDEGELTTGQIRLILNCMRHDAAVAADMPAPKFPFVVRKQAIAPVIPIQRDRRSQKTGPQDCGNKEPHEYHRLGVGNWCNGVPFEINRRYTVKTSARIHTQRFAVTKSGALVHKITGEARLTWRPHPHDWGFVDHPVGVTVKTMCKNPSWIDGGHLFEEEPIHLYTDDVFTKSRCHRCFSVQELREGPPPEKRGVPQVVFQPPEQA